MALLGSSAGCRDARPSTEAVAAASSEAAPVRVTDRVQLDASQVEQIGVEELSGKAPANAIKATGTVEFNADRMFERRDSQAQNAEASQPV